MASPRLTCLVLLTGGVPFALLMGLLDGDWGGLNVLSAVVVGVIGATVTWFLPIGPHGVSEELWDALSRSQKRAVLEAVSRGEPLPEGLHPWTAGELRRQIKEEKPGTWFDRPQAALIMAGFAVVVALSADRGAPPGWVAAGCVSFAIWLAVGIYIRLPRGRRVTA